MTYHELKLLRETLRQEKRYDTYVKKERMRLESESEMDRYVKRGLELVSVFPKFLLSLSVIPLLTILMFLLSLMVVFVISVMYVKDLLVGLIQLCWAPFYQVLKKLKVLLKK